MFQKQDNNIIYACKQDLKQDLVQTRFIENLMFQKQDNNIIYACEQDFFKTWIRFL